MTKAEDPPSPPRRSWTSATVMNILAKADKELSVSESKAEVEQAIVNPYERTGPKIPIANRRKPIPVKKSAPPPPKAAEPKKPDLPSSAQVIADSLPTPKAQAAKPSANGNLFRAPLSKPTVSSSPFLPPGKTAPSTTANGSSSGPFTVDDVDDDDEIMEVSAPEGSSSKSQANGSTSRARGLSPPRVEELGDEEMAESSQKASKPSLVVEPTEPRRIGRSPSIGPYPNLYSPTIPSPLRLVSMPEVDELAEDIDTPDAAIQPKQSIPRAAALQLVPNKSSDVEMVDDSDADPQSQAERASVSSLPSYKFDFTIIATAIIPGIDVSAKAKASAATKTELPKFDMLALVPVPAQAPAAPSNNWAAAGFVPKAAGGGSWTCDQCMLSNPESAKDKCTICEADRPGAKSKPTSTAPPPSQPAPANNWAAAGFVPKAPGGGSWTCNQCMLSNPESAKDKCTICEADRPGAMSKPTSTAPPPSQPATANNWAASGFAFTKPAAGTWTCPDCMLTNPASVTDKCTVCGADAPGSKAGTTTDARPATVAPPAQPASGFNWSAAGFKPQAVAPGTWTCSVCGLNNGPELTKCGVCEAAR
ncbi:hypothetical protein M407DRAFT_24802 [Tulasnella calospora MUT 4182]|uniref:RanBP2-type domain-containing protein n=1 Tax=Tulasnella calospora MUT 4182 TaxID=1051891 RepID=A0A0C3QH87_9AGAM|nr:hypothetical protein M407DRAFT_24802 [Tulasnella calospora MUT 4182]